MMTSQGVSASRVRRAALLVAFIVFTLKSLDCEAKSISAAVASDKKDQDKQQHHPMPEAFKNAGQRPGLEIWRVENFAPVSYPKNDYGKFYSGDSYLVLNTKQDKNGKRTWDIHFWLGKETSQDESGAAAAMAVQLDDGLGGDPVQHREVQEHESQLFLSYFKSGIRYVAGGVASGFKHVDRNAFEKRLFQVKGKRNVRVKQVEPKVQAMNKGDCFILDVGRDIYVYTGENSKRTERLKAISAANQIRDQDHSGRSRVHIVDSSSTEAEVKKFFEELGSGSPSQVPPESSGGDDEQFERDIESSATLYKVSDESGTLKVDTITQKPLHQNQLKPEDCFILDTGSSGLYVWVGKTCNSQERSEAMKKAQNFLTTKGYPSWTQVTRVIQSGETSQFKQYFGGWREAADMAGLGRRFTREAIASIDNHPYDASTLNDAKLKQICKNSGAAFSFMPDDGTGHVEAWRVEDFNLVPVHEGMLGMFFGGDSYVIKYTYQNAEGQNKSIMYYWLGSTSTSDEKITAAIQTAQMGKGSTHIRVLQGQEPHHFMKIFKGRMITLIGGKASGFHNRLDEDTYDVDGTRLFQVRGTCESDVHAEQVPEKSESLNSDDTFILETPEATWIWVGHGTSEEEIIYATSAATVISPQREVQIVVEGEEPEKFWEALGGKSDYKNGFNTDAIPPFEPRLIHCHITDSGKFKWEEIHDFKQEDLEQDDVMVLDTGDEIYLWLGNDSSPKEKKMSTKLIEGFLKKDPYGRDPSGNLLITIHQGDEPASFKNIFPNWDNSYWEVSGGNAL